MSHALLHAFGVAGLVANIAGTLLLLWFPPTVQGYTKDGHQTTSFFSELPEDAEQRRQWKRRFIARAWGFRGAMVLLLAGFGLQLVDLLTP